MQNLHDLEYMSWVMMETLRIQAPGPVTATLVLTKDTKVGNLNLKKNDEFMVNMHALHHNANQW
jgi:cytochrome P450